MALATLFSGPDDLIIIVVALVVVFGGSQLPKLAHNTGEALREFRRARSDAETGTVAPAATAPGAVPPGVGNPVATPALHHGALPAAAGARDESAAPPLK